MKRTLALLLALLCPAQVFWASEIFPGAPAEDEIGRLIAKTSPAYVFIGGGSGVVISPSGLMLTNNHVVSKEKTMQVRTGDGKAFTAVVLGKDPVGDLALLQIKEAKDLSCLPLGDSDALRLGEFCIAIGNPFAAGTVDQSPTVSLGVISGLHVFHGNYADAVVTDAPINPGNSGGPLINRRGEVVGINGMIQTRWGLKSNTGLGFAIPSNQIKLWLPHFEKANGGMAYHGRLNGITFDREEDDLVLEARIKGVAAESDAQKAGFLAGDVVRSIDGKPVQTPLRFRSLLSIYPAGTSVTATVLRGQAEKTLTFTLESMRGGNLGFSLARPTRGDRQVRVGEVQKNLAKAGEGLKAGDRIVAIDGHALNGPLTQRLIELSMRLQQVRPGQEVAIKVLRGEGAAETEVVVTLVADAG